MPPWPSLSFSVGQPQQPADDLWTRLLVATGAAILAAVAIRYMYSNDR